eukprot:177483-Prorocentrum_minimum.AAC.5
MSLLSQKTLASTWRVVEPKPARSEVASSERRTSKLLSEISNNIARYNRGVARAAVVGPSVAKKCVPPTERHLEGYEADEMTVSEKVAWRLALRYDQGHFRVTKNFRATKTGSVT